MNAVLEATRAKLAKRESQLQALIGVDSPAAKEGRSLTEPEAEKFEKLSSDIAKLSAGSTSLEAADARAAAAAAAAAETAGNADTGYEGRDATGNLSIRSEPKTYEAYDGSASYLRDIAHIAASNIDSGAASNAPAARERLARHAKEVEVESRTDKRLASVLRGIKTDLLHRSGAVTEFEKRVNPNTTAGTGGEFVPPLWLESWAVPFVRPGRVCANRVRNLPLPPGIDVINIPKITLGSRTAIQAANAAPVMSQDITTATVSANVNTIAGEEDISLQLLEQSPLAMDGIIFDDLGADYDQQLDLQVLAGTGSNGQHLGVFSVTSATTNASILKASQVTVSSATFHDATTAGTQYRSIVNGVNQVETLRIASPTGIWVHPRRSNSWAYASDGQNRPLFVPARYSPYNVLGNNEASPVPEGIAGELFGLPVIKDANVPTLCNSTALTGGTADAIAVLKEDDLILFEGTPRLRALPEILSGTLQIRFQLYNYSAFIPGRFLPSISLLFGNAGLAAPGF